MKSTQSLMRTVAYGVALAALAGVVRTTAAGAAETSGATVGLEEVVVTARKAEEQLQRTPVAVTALTTADLTDRQVVQVADLQRTTPNLAIGGAGTGPTSIVYMSLRGEAQNSPNSASDNAVGIYLDGVYYGRPIVGNLGVLDIARAEVLRGPQGTLFGRNTTGGALNIVSNQPTDKFEGYVKLGGGDYGSELGEAVVNVPIIGSELDARAAFQYKKHDAYYDDPISGRGLGALNHDYIGRATVRWAPTNIPLTLTVSADMDQMYDTGVPTALVGFNPAAPPGLGLIGLIPFLSPYNLANYLSTDANWKNSYGNQTTPDPEINTSFDSNNAKGISATLDADVGPAHLKSITAYRESDTANAFDLDGTPVNIASDISEYVQHQASEELQLSGTVGKLDLIGGLYYFREGGSERSDSDTFSFLSDFHIVPFPNGVREDFTNFLATSKAAFAQGNYHITDTVRATAGFRYTWDTRSLDRHGRTDILGTTPAGNQCGVGVNAGTSATTATGCSDPRSATFSYPAWTIGLDWQASENLFVYVKSSRASMAGGFNTRPVPSTVSDAFGPESNTDVELGVKDDFLEHHLRTNVALFHGWQKNVQRIVNTVIPGNPPTLTQYQTNAGDSQTYGAEFEVTALPWKGMEITASASYLHAAYDAGTFQETQIVNGTAVSVDRSNEPIPQAPKYVFGLGATQTVPVPWGNASFHLDYAWRDDVVYTWDTPAAQLPAATIAQWNTANQLGTLPHYGLLSGRITLNISHPDIEISVWGRNLTDTHYFQQQFDSYTGLGTAVDYKGDPRTFGATVAYHW
jgi:iron complex outermembrane recepter protein